MSEHRPKGQKGTIMQVEYGKCYRRRDGKKEGPMELTPQGHTFYETHPWRSGRRTYCDNGKFAGREEWPDTETSYDLIEEWPDELPHGHARLPDGGATWETNWLAMMEYKTLREWNVGPGDLVEREWGDVYEVKARAPGVLALWSVDRAEWWIGVAESMLEYRIIDRGPLPYGHARLPSGEVVDLTANTEAHSLMHPAKRAAMRAHGGPYLWHDLYGTWSTKTSDGWFSNLVYQVVSNPAPKPREGWVAVLHPTRRACKAAHPGIEPMFVRGAGE